MRQNINPPAAAAVAVTQRQLSKAFSTFFHFSSDCNSTSFDTMAANSSPGFIFEIFPPIFFLLFFILSLCRRCCCCLLCTRCFVSYFVAFFNSTPHFKHHSLNVILQVSLSFRFHSRFHCWAASFLCRLCITFQHPSIHLAAAYRLFQPSIAAAAACASLARMTLSCFKRFSRA